MPEKSYQIPAVVRATQLLERLCESDAPLGVSELSRQLGTNKNMVFRLLQTLEEAGWIVQEDGPKYRVGMLPFRLFSKSAKIGVREAAASPLRKLHGETGEGCYIAVLDGDRCLFVDHLDSTRDVRALGRIGGSYALHSCAPGKILLAHADARLRDEILGGDLEANTIVSITSSKKLRKELDQVLEQGYAVDIEEYTRGMLCLAAPVFDATGRVAGSLGITVLTLYYTSGELIAHLGPKVIKAADEASANLGADVATIRPFPFA
jgi:IclR family transcriptional regulator, KDG regulon repressor